MYQFIDTTFIKNAKWNFNQILNQINPSHILEVGSNEGASVCFFIEKLSNTRELFIDVIDTPETTAPYQPENIAFASEKVIVKPQVIQHMTDDISVKLMQHYLDGYDNFYNMVEYTPTEGTSTTLCNLTLLFKLLRPGGSLVINDFIWNKDRMEINDFPRMAIDLFTLAYASKIHIMPSMNSQIFILKLED